MRTFTENKSSSRLNRLLSRVLWLAVIGLMLAAFAVGIPNRFQTLLDPSFMTETVAQ